MVAIKGNTVQFCFFCPWPRAVDLEIEVQGRGRRKMRMVRIPEGYWLAQAVLPAGGVRFRYCADGKWLTDPDELEIDRGPDGPCSFVEVCDSARAADAAPAEGPSG